MPNNGPLSKHTDQASLKAMGMDGPPSTWTPEQRRLAGVKPEPKAPPVPRVVAKPAPKAGMAVTGEILGIDSSGERTAYGIQPKR